MIEPRSNLSHEGVDKREAPEFFPALDGLRAMAAFFVLLTHAGFLTATYSLGAVGAVLARMDIGVAIFFCLSGFLLSRPYLAAELSQRPRPSLRRYGWHRAIRILPAYWVALTVVLLTLARGVPADVLMSNVTLTQVYTNDELPGFTQTWSLCTEVAFYALLPLIAPWIFRSAARSTTMLAIRLCCIGGIAFFWIVAVVGDFLPLGAYAAQWLPGHLDWFAAGMLVAVAERVIAQSSSLAGHLRDLLQSPGSLLALAFGLWGIVCTPLGGPLYLEPTTAWQAVFKEAIYAAVAFTLVATLALGSTRSPVVAPFAHRLARSLGRVSYGFFLWHLLIMHGIFNALGLNFFSGDFVVVTVATVVVSLAVSYASWIVVERPLMRRAQMRA